MTQGLPEDSIFTFGVTCSDSYNETGPYIFNAVTTLKDGPSFDTSANSSYFNNLAISVGTTLDYYLPPLMNFDELIGDNLTVYESTDVPSNPLVSAPTYVSI
jgi:hypothetical protein